ncbi:MAG: hypothetical protein OEZ04_13360 [Nitrospinota bacterium]|nr:hypothetical protein [Nitrospinota bacterium]
MTTAGWVMFLFSWTLIISLSSFCMTRVLGLKNSQAEHIKPIHEIDTGDLTEEASKHREGEGKSD